MACPSNAAGDVGYEPGRNLLRADGRELIEPPSKGLRVAVYTLGAAGILACAINVGTAGYKFYQKHFGSTERPVTQQVQRGSK